MHARPATSRRRFLIEQLERRELLDGTAEFLTPRAAETKPVTQVAQAFKAVADDNPSLVVELTPLNPFERKLDGQWQGSFVASDGKVYFGSSTHAHDAAARLFQYDPSTGVVRSIGDDISTVLGEDPTTQVPQGKLHSPVVEVEGWLYTSAYLGNYWDEAQNAYTGSHLFGYRLGSVEENNPEFRDLGIPRPRHSTYSAVAVDPEGEFLWSISVPSAQSDVAASGSHLHRTHIETGVTQDYGSITGFSGAQGAFAIHVDNRGDAWLAPIFGGDKLYVARADTLSIESFDQALPAMMDQYKPGETSEYQDGSWWRWGQSIDGERFLFTMSDYTAPFADRSGGSLWEFDASKTLDGDFSDAFTEVAWIGGNNLGATVSGDTFYFVRRDDGYHNPKIDGPVDNGATWDPNSDTGARLHLYSTRLEDPDGIVSDRGMITDAEGRIPWRIESVSADRATDRVYLTGDWIMKDSDPDHWKTLRHDGGLSTTYTQYVRGQAFAVADTSNQADLHLTKTDGVTTVLPGETVTYTIKVKNLGPATATDVTVSDTFSQVFDNVTWTAHATGGAAGFQSNGNGDIHDSAISLPDGASIIYTVQATVSPSTSHRTLITNTATVSDQGATLDPDSTNNSGTDGDTMVIAAARRAIVETHPLTPYQQTLDGQWQGTFVASDQKVYFASSTHAHDEAARLFQYDPVTQIVTMFDENLSEIVGEDPTQVVPQGKLRSITESNGWLFMDTHLANYWDEAQDVYTGGHLFGYRLGSLEEGEAEFRNFGIPKARYTNYSAVDVSPDGRYLWTVAVPFAIDDILSGGSYVHRTEIATGQIVEVGVFSPGLDRSQAAFGFHVDASGDAWITSAYGSNQLHRIDNETLQVESFNDVLPPLMDPNTPGQPSDYQQGRWWRWNHQVDDNRFLFTMFADVTVASPNRSGGSIWEFDSSQVRGDDFSTAFREVAWIGGHTLAMAYSEGTVYFVRRNDGSHDPRIFRNGELWDPDEDTGARLHLYSVDVNDPAGTITDWGLISDAEGRVPWRIVALSANKMRGEVYITGDLVMKQDDPIETRSYRHDETASHIYTRRIHGQAFMVAQVAASNNGRPVLDSPIPNASVSEDRPFDYDASTHFSDPDGEPLVYSVSGATWLSIDPTSGTISGTPSNENVGVNLITVTARDPSGAPASDTFALEVVNLNDPPQLQSGLPDTEATATQLLQYDVSSYFADEDAGDMLTYSARLAGGADLPAWLTIDPATGLLVGTPSGADAGQLDIQVTATDLAGASASGVFGLTIYAFRPIQYSGSGDLLLRLDASGELVELSRGGAVVVSQALEITDSIEIFGADNSSDSLEVDLAGGLPIPFAGMVWDGRNGSGRDDLVISGGSVDRITFEYDSSDSSAGLVRIVDGSTLREIDFRGLEPITIDTETADLVFDLTDHDDAVTLSRVAGNRSTIAAATFEDTTFVNPSNSLTINGLSGNDTIDISGLTLDGTNLVLDADHVVVSSTLDTNGGDIRSSGELFESRDRARIVTDGGEIRLSHQNTQFGESVITSGGAIHSSGTGFFSMLDTGAYFRTSGVGDQGHVTIAHDGGVTVQAMTTGGGNVTIDSQGDVRVRGSVSTRGRSTAGDFSSTGNDFVLDDRRSIKTAGGDVDLQHRGTVTLRHSITTDGGSFLSSGAGAFVAADAGARIQTRGRSGDENVKIDHGGDVTLYDITTGGGVVDIDAGGHVWLRGRVNTVGTGDSHFSSAGASFASDRGKTILTGGGDIMLQHDGLVSIGAAITTSGGALSSSGQGDFLAWDRAANLTTSGRYSDGAVNIDHDGNVSLQRISTGGGDITLVAGSHVKAHSRIDARGGPGNISIGGQSVTTVNNASIWTSGGNVSLGATQFITLGEYVRTDGGDFMSIGGGTLTTADTGAYIRTSGGGVTIDHVGAVDLNGLLDSGGGALDLTLHIHAGIAQPLLEVFGNLDFNGGVLTIDMDRNPIASLGGLPVRIEEIIVLSGKLIEMPLSAQVIDRALTDPDFLAILSDPSDKTLDLLLQAV